ncbi:hypothetical protein [Salinisphaera orenii]|uniref:hypothetical protein n=1 Tax=Salinisphaera orenii TaxID=856731 RepID=UPI000DBE089A
MSANVDEILKSAGIVPAVPGQSRNDRDAGTIGTRAIPEVPAVPVDKCKAESANDESLAAKLRWLGCPIALEVDGEVVTWVVADDAEADSRWELSPMITASEAEVLAGLDTGGIRRLLRMKARLGGRIEPAKTET